MADTIGVSRKWIQHPGTWKEHFDISKGKRAEAVRAGTIQITWRKCVAMSMRETGQLGKPEHAELWHKIYVRNITGSGISLEDLRGDA